MAVSFLMEYKGFTISKVDIKKLSDGETVDVNVYYDRKVINLTFILDGGVTETELIDNQLTGKFDDFFIIYDPVKIGYEFDGWSDPVPEAFPSEDYIFKAVWIPLGNIEYKVEHYQQNIKDNDYENIEVETGSVEASVPTLTGDTSLDFNVVLDKPGDFYEFSVDVVNKGTLDAMIKTLNKKFYFFYDYKLLFIF